MHTTRTPRRTSSSDCLTSLYLKLRRRELIQSLGKSSLVQCGENKWNARCVEEDSGMRYLVGLDEECNMTVVDAMKDFLVYAWNR
ncbi:hypothetical protein FHG87_008784 [Trinorchestia longiramus]|nr:hypothetical protein FHG87_008784 [Trinorchestia longiramus]